MKLAIVISFLFSNLMAQHYQVDTLYESKINSSWLPLEKTIYCNSIKFENGSIISLGDSIMIGSPDSFRFTTMEKQSFNFRNYPLDGFFKNKILPIQKIKVFRSKKKSEISLVLAFGKMFVVVRNLKYAQLTGEIWY